MRIFLTSSWVKQGKGHNSYTDQYDTQVIKKKILLDLKEVNVVKSVNAWRIPKIFVIKNTYFVSIWNFFQNV